MILEGENYVGWKVGSIGYVGVFWVFLFNFSFFVLGIYYAFGKFVKYM